MKVKKRNGREVNFNPLKITKRIKDQSIGLKVKSDELAIKIMSQMVDGITSRELDNLCVEGSAMKIIDHPDYSTLAARIYVSSLRKHTPDSFSEAVNILNEDTNQLRKEFVQYVNKYKVELDFIIDHDRDLNHDIFGLKTLERSYLLRGKGPDSKTKGEIIERPQYLMLREAIEVTALTSDLLVVQETYDLLSQKYYTHATPTLFNSGTALSQLSSCFLLSTKGDDIDGLFDTIKDCARISKLAGGIGLEVHGVRARGSLIAGTNGKSDGLIPMFKTYNETARWINQGGKRKGSFAMYLEPWHADIFDFLEMKKNHGKEEMRARDLFYALWINDLFMQRVAENGDWTLFCPNEVLKHNGTVLQELVGNDFNIAYNRLVEEGVGRVTIKARELWEKMLVSQMETGTPYMVYKDKANLASNQKNLGVIKSSNLCAEIIEYTSPEEQAVCNLASIALNRFVVINKDETYFDFDKLRDVTKIIIKNLDNVIDQNYYPTAETEISNFNHRPVGLGVQGLADVFAMMKMNFDSQEARDLNKEIFENLYFASLESSNQLAKEKGSYSSFSGSPAHNGFLQFDMYNEKPVLKDYLDWDGLTHSIMKNGLRNSLLLALMPTASTSQILGNNECFEPFTSNLYLRRTLAGEYIVVNKHLVKDLEEVDLWNDSIRNQLKLSNGSVQGIYEIPQEIRDRYKTSYELSQKVIIDLAADRQRFVCQSQSMNLFIANPDFGKLSSMHLYAWKQELKTGIYYLRSKSAVDAIKFTATKEAPKVSTTLEIDTSQEEEIKSDDYKEMIQRARNAQEDDDCEMCGS